MNKSIILAAILGCTALTASAQENAYINLDTKVKVEIPVSSVESITMYGTDAESVAFATATDLKKLYTSMQGEQATLAFEQGGLSSSNGSTVDYKSSAPRIRTTAKVGNLTKITVNDNAAYIHLIVKYKADGTFDSAISLDSKKTTTYDLDPSYKYRFVFRSQTSASTEITVDALTGHVAVEYGNKIDIINSDIATLKTDVAAAKANTGVGSISGLKFMGFGDSVAAGANSNKTTWTALAAGYCSGTVLLDAAVAGKKIAEIRSQVESAASGSYSPDVILLEGSLNDMVGTTEESGGTTSSAYTVDQFESSGIGMGTFSQYDYTAPAGTGTDLTSQVEYIMYTVKKTWKNATPIWILTHRTEMRNYELQEKVYDRIIECAKKWGVVIVDVFHESAMYSTSSATYTDGSKNNVLNGTHPTLAGYKKYYMPMIMDAINKYARVYE